MYRGPFKAPACRSHETSAPQPSASSPLPPQTSTCWRRRMHDGAVRVHDPSASRRSRGVRHHCQIVSSEVSGPGCRPAASTSFQSVHRTLDVGARCGENPAPSGSSAPSSSPNRQPRRHAARRRPVAVVLARIQFLRHENRVAAASCAYLRISALTFIGFNARPPRWRAGCRSSHHEFGLFCITAKRGRLS